MTTFTDEIKYEIKNKMFMKLIFINIGVFILIQFLNVITRLSGINFETTYINFFTLKTNFNEFISSPWGIFTSIFCHFDIFHLLFNMLFLYFIGKLAEFYLGGKSVFILYLFGGIFGGIVEIINHSIFDNLIFINSNVVGASGSIMSIFIAIAIYKPKTDVSLYGIFNIKIIWLAVIYFLLDLIKIGKPDGIAHLAHLGGAICGYLLITNRSFLNKLNSFFTYQPKQKLKVKHGGRPLSDEDFNLIKLQNEEKTNKILEKISKSGYESLTKAEKEFLFKQSKNG